MEFSLLGCDDDALRLVRYLIRERGHRVRAVYGVASLPPPWAELLSDVPLESSWEAILEANNPGLVLVTRSQTLEANYQPLRGLAQAEVPLVIMHPACTAIAGLELDMIRRDTKGLLIPYVPGAWHPALEKLSQFIHAAADSPESLGEIQRLEWECRMVTSSRSRVFEQLARDAAMLRCLIGDLQRVSALGSQTSGEALNRLSVSLTTPGNQLVQWNLFPDQSSSARLLVQGTNRRATLEMPSPDSPWRLSLDGATPTHLDFPANANLPPFCTWLESLLPSAPAHPKKDSITGVLRYDWVAACHDLEVMETAEISLRRGRAIDLQTETPTEEATFKAMMAAGGCGLLLVTLLVFGVLAVVGGLQLAYHDPVETATAAAPAFSWFRLWPLIPFAIFLALQVLLMVARGSRKPTT